MEYRECTKEDISFIQEYQKKYVLRFEDPTMVEMKDVLELLHTKIEGNAQGYRSIYLDEIKVGYVHLIEQIDLTYLLDDLYVLEEYRNQGIGTMILQDMISNTDECIYVYMYMKNTKLIDFFMKRDFYVKKIISKSRMILQRDH